MQKLAGHCWRAAFGAMGCLIAVPLIARAAVFAPPFAPETNPPSLAAAARTAGLMTDFVQVPSGYVLFSENGSALPLPRMARWSQKPGAMESVTDFATAGARDVSEPAAGRDLPSATGRPVEPGSSGWNLRSGFVRVLVFAPNLVFAGIVVGLVFRALHRPRHAPFDSLRSPA